jgi:hypothetical protein
MIKWVLVGALFMASLAFGGWELSQVQELKKELQEEQEARQNVQEKLSEYKQNQDFIVKETAEKFLRAYLEVDTEKGENKQEKIKPYATAKAREKLDIPGEGSRTKSKIKIEVTGLTLYYSATAPDQANVLAKIKRTTSIDGGTGVEAEDLMELQLVLKDNKWLVDDTRLLTQLEGE